MSRRSRIVIPNTPHHLTQRGTRRQEVFFKPGDREIYLGLLKENAERYGTQVLAYSLMTNHVHHLVVPLEDDSLRWTFQMTHKRYADYINGRGGWTGHLWQQRFYSSPVDREYFWVALRYILRNPVEANLVRHAADYPWSSAKYHCNSDKSPLLTTQVEWVQLLKTRNDWFNWLAEPEELQKVSLLRKRTSQDLPTGSKSFLDELRAKFGVRPYPPVLGRPKKG